MEPMMFLLLLLIFKEGTKNQNKLLLDYLKVPIVHCYSLQIVVRINVHVSPLFIWHVAQIVVHVVSFVVTTCVLDQSHGHWLLSDALHSTITMNTKLVEELQNLPNFDNIMDEDFRMVIELTLLVSNIQKEVYVVLDSFLF
jgi:hypothetical protein